MVNERVLNRDQIVQVNSSGLQELIGLAKCTSRVKRRAILIEITRIFEARQGAFSEMELGYFGEILGEIAGTLEKKVCKELFERLCDQSHVPRPLAVQLASDEIAVAEPMLRKSVALTNDDLIAVANEQSQAHLLAITQRIKVPEVIADLLIERGDNSVLVKLLANKAATISKPGFEKLIELAETNRALHHPLVFRKELPLELLNCMFFFVSNNLQKEIVQRNQAISKKKLKAAIARSSRRFRRVKSSRPQVEIQTEFKVDELECNKLLNQQTLIQLLRDGNVQEFFVAFARLTSLDIGTIGLIVLDKKSDALALVCRALDYDSETFAALLSFDYSSKNFNFNRSYVKKIELYSEIPSEGARRTVRFWRTRQKAISNEKSAEPLSSSASAA